MNRKVLFLSYGDYQFDGRLRELINVAKSLGDITYITTTSSKRERLDSNHVPIITSGVFSYIKFIIYCIAVGFKSGETDILFIDNRKAVIPGIFIKFFKKPKYIIQDVRELYLINEVKHFSGKVGCIFEQYLLKKSDIVISANKHRADIMKNYFKLISAPLIYENIRALEYAFDVDIHDLEKRYGHLFNNDTVKIISTSGCSVERTNDILVKGMTELGEKYELFLVGGCSEEDNKIITNIIKENKLNNVYLIDKLNINELKYFIGKSHIGIVNYHQKDTNNKYCASGKIYEYLFEGLPVITTENITLIELCNKYKIGLSDNNYVNGIKKISDNYSYYKENVIKYMGEFDVKKNNNLLLEGLNKLINYK